MHFIKKRNWERARARAGEREGITAEKDLIRHPALDDDDVDFFNDRSQ